jgi:aryl-alcohol dehydrogenase-like predicted oxidoreductase
MPGGRERFDRSGARSHRRDGFATSRPTGVRVCVAGLGYGGFSRLGLGTGKSKTEAVALVRQALDMGVNLLDTAAAYGTEAVVGEAIRTVPREDVVIATRAWIPRSAGRHAAEREIPSRIFPRF